MKKATLIAIGAGGYTLEPSSRSLDRLFIQKTGKNRPHICLLPTASGDRAQTIEDFHTTFQGYGARTSHLSLFSLNSAARESHLLQQDGIYITGGNTKSMLALWKEWGLTQALQRAYEQGVVLCGISAGAISFFEQGFSDSVCQHYCPINGLGLLPGSFCPHYSPQEKRALTYAQHIHQGLIQPGIGLEDGVALCFENGQLAELIRSRRTAQAYWLDRTGIHDLEAT